MRQKNTVFKYEVKKEKEIAPKCRNFITEKCHLKNGIFHLCGGGYVLGKFDYTESARAQSRVYVAGRKQQQKKIK